MQASSKRWREDVGFEMFNRYFSDSWRSKVTVMLTMLCYRGGEPSAVIKKGFYRVGKSGFLAKQRACTGDARSSPACKI